MLQEYTVENKGNNNLYLFNLVIITGAFIQDKLVHCEMQFAASFSTCIVLLLLPRCVFVGECSNMLRPKGGGGGGGGGIRCA